MEGAVNIRDTDQNAEVHNEGGCQDDQTGGGKERRNDAKSGTINGNEYVSGNSSQTQHGVTTADDGSCLAGEEEANTASTASLKKEAMQHHKVASESSKDTADSGSVYFNTTSQNDLGVSTSKQRHVPPPRPRETRASQLRTKPHSVTETNAQNSNVRQQRSLKSDKTPSARPVKGTLSPHALRSRSTSSDDSSEKDTLESTTGKGLDPSSDLKSRDQSNTARHELPENHQYGLSTSAMKTPPPSAHRLNTKPRESADSSPLNQNKSKSLGHDVFSPYGPTEKYLTPLQQKERHNKELNTKISKLEQTVWDQDERIQQFEDEKQEALDKLNKTKDTEIGQLLIEIKKQQMQLRQSESSLKEIADSLNEEKMINSSMKEQITKMQTEHDEREAVHQKRYLDMYQKGREAQLIDQEEDLVCRAIAAAPDGDSQTRRLVKKLEQTEHELEKLRQTFREDVYHKTPQVDTDSAAQVEVLKSAVYYYLTDTQPEVNLKVMLSMLNYSAVQKRNIISHLKKNKSK